MKPIQPITQAQIAAACRLHAKLSQWRLSDESLVRLRESTPGFDEQSCLLKTVAVNALYGTQVFAQVRMARHVADVVAKVDLASAGIDLVEAIATLKTAGRDKPRKHVSFAAKFCHFFVDEERFPIYDEAAREAIRLHLGTRAYRDDPERPYAAFCENLDRLRTESGLSVRARELDRYLWLTGMYKKWLRERIKPKSVVNAELQKLFSQAAQGFEPDVEAMLPPGLERPAGTTTELLSVGEGSRGG